MAFDDGSDFASPWMERDACHGSCWVEVVFFVWTFYLSGRRGEQNLYAKDDSPRHCRVDLQARRMQIQSKILKT